VLNLWDSDSFCSHPSGACVQHMMTSSAITLPAITHTFSPLSENGLPTPNITCFDNSTLKVRGLVAKPGMLYEFLARAQAVNPNGTVSISCNPARSSTKGMVNATLTISGATESWLTWVGGTEYDQDAGDRAHGFTFRGPDPHAFLSSLLGSATSPSLTYASILSAHTNDFTTVMSPFALSLGQSPNLSNSTDKLVAAYKTDVGDAYLEWLLFNYGRYLLASSARGVLPANLQGKWAKDARNIWSSGRFQHPVLSSPSCSDERSLGQIIVS
jgi:alpha-L-fucosidase 2